jgi:predicted DNA-binding transcriptional regulator YafY
MESVSLEIAPRAKRGRATRVHRLIRMAVELGRGNPLDSRTTASQFGISTRTFFRDIQVLGSSGLTVVLDERIGGYTLRGVDWE